MPWNIQSLRRGCVVENREHSFDRLQQVRAYPPPVAVFIEPLQVPVFEAPDSASASRTGFAEYRERLQVRPRAEACPVADVGPQLKTGLRQLYVPDTMAERKKDLGLPSA
jgi:hypothetical protein